MIPEVGMGATFVIGADYYPYTITKIVSPKRIAVTYDPVAGNDIREAVHNPDQDIIVSLRKNGRWVSEGSTMRGGGFYSIGNRTSRLDPSF